MIKKIIILSILFGQFLSAQDIQWQKKSGGQHADYLFDAIPTLDYGFLMVGGSLSDNTGDVKSNSGDFDYFISKINEKGELEWTRMLGGDKTDILKSITNTYDGGYIIAGISDSGKSAEKSVQNIGQKDIWLLKIDINGGLEWQKSLGGFGNEDIADVLKTKDGGYLLAASSASEDCTSKTQPNTNPNLILKATSNRGNSDYWLVKLNMNGNLEWQKTFGGKYKDELKQVLELEDGSIIIGGSSNSPESHDKKIKNKGLNDWWVLKLNKNGELLWQKSFGDEGDDHLSVMIRAKDGNVLLGGNYRDKGKNGTSDFVLIKTDVNGNMIWKNTYDNGANDFLTDVLQNEDGSLILSGYTEAKKTGFAKKMKLPSLGHRKGTEDFMLIKINAKGEEKWRKSVGTNKKEVLKKCIETRDGGYVLMGSSMPSKVSGKNNADFLIVKLKDKDKPLHEKLPLEAVPNPVQRYTQVIIGRDYKQGILSVVDMSGKTLWQTKIDGKRIVPVNLQNYPAGVYIININVDDLSNSVKVLKGESEK